VAGRLVDGNRPSDQGDNSAKPPREVLTRLLLAWGQGDEAALDQLMPLVFDGLRRIAARHMRSERQDHTLQTTALVNEAYLRLVDQKRAEWRNRAQFFAVAARLMRRILVDHARRPSAKRRGATLIALEDRDVPAPEKSADVIALDEALTRLAAFDPRKSRVVELRIFGGMTIEETAEALGVSIGTVKNDYRAARAWLRREMGKGG
jgi:RNA polymerase sigma factor (TIGR02999 family)